MPLEQSRIFHRPPEAASSGQSETQQAHSQDIAPKPSRIPGKTIALIEYTHTAGLDNRLDERRRQLLTHLAANPHKTLQELASIAGVTTKERVRQLCESGLTELWQELSPEDQQQYPLAELLRRINRAAVGRTLSPEHKEKIRAARTGTTHSPETREKIGKAHKGKQVSAETRAQMSKSRTGKNRSPETRALMSKAKRAYWERKKQQRELQQTSHVFPSPEK